MRLAEAELGEVGTQLARRELVGGQHGADVGRLGQDAGQGQLDQPVLPVVVDDAVLTLPAGRGPAILVRAVDPAGVDQRGQREHLLHRAGLVGQVERAGAAGP